MSKYRSERTEQIQNNSMIGFIYQNTQIYLETYTILFLVIKLTTSIK